MLKISLGGWKDRSAFKSTFCSYRGPPGLILSLQQSVTPFPGVLTPSFDTGTRHACGAQACLKAKH